jgi:hypothetical protein
MRSAKSAYSSRFDQIVEAHTDMEQNRAGGKLTT